MTPKKLNTYSEGWTSHGKTVLQKQKMKGMLLSIKDLRNQYQKQDCSSNSI